MDGELVAQVATLGDADGIDLTDQVGDRCVGSRELLRVALVGCEPRELGRVAVLGDEIAAAPADRCVRIVVDLAARNRRHGVVEERDQGTDESRFRLPALTEQDHVLAGKDRVLDLRDHRVVVPADAVEQLLVGAELADQVASKLGPDRQDAVFRATQLTDRGRGLGHRIPKPTPGRWIDCRAPPAWRASSGRGTHVLRRRGGRQAPAPGRNAGG